MPLNTRLKQIVVSDILAEMVSEGLLLFRPYHLKLSKVLFPDVSIVLGIRYLGQISANWVLVLRFVNEMNLSLDI